MSCDIRSRLLRIYSKFFFKKPGTNFRGVELGKWSDNRFAGAWHKLRSAAKLPEDIHLHDLRRTAGLTAARVGGLQVAQRLLGHADIATTAKVYAPLTTDDLREHQAKAVAKILPLKRNATGRTEK